MEYVREHLTKHHFLHAPHHWFLALLVSPVHLAELHYQKRYHLRFVHAKKLFLFDFTLLLSVIALFGITLFLFLYEPSVVASVSLSITPSNNATPATKIQSGDDITYTVAYANKSGVLLQDPHLSVSFPLGFVLESAAPSELFTPANNTFVLPPIPPGGSGEAVIKGILFGTPDETDRVSAQLSYRQEQRTDREIRIANVLTTLRGSILEGALSGSHAILPTGSSPITVTLTNTATHSLPSLVLPLAMPSGISLHTVTTTAGTIESQEWRVKELPPHESIRLTGVIQTNLEKSAQHATLQLTPLLFVRNATFPQTLIQYEWNVLHPNIEFSAFWNDARETARPGEVVPLTLTIHNNGDTVLNDATIDIPFPSSLIVLSQLTQYNAGVLAKETLTLNKKYIAGLASLEPGSSLSLSLQVPLRSNPQGGTDLSVILSPRIRASVPLASNDSIDFDSAIHTKPLHIGTNLILSADMRYFTPEGDQLGRGPLPLAVGKETKYWAIITIQNTTSAVSDLSLSATLPPGVSWTGKTSVSHGSAVLFNEKNKMLSWSHKTMPAYQKIGIYIELSWTPSQSDIGKTPLLLKDIVLSGHDTYIDAGLTKTYPNLDASLKNDTIAQKKGTKVQ